MTKPDSVAAGADARGAKIRLFIGTVFLYDFVVVDNHC
jgi:hypothetical protein